MQAYSNLESAKGVSGQYMQAYHKVLGVSVTNDQTVGAKLSKPQALFITEAARSLSTTNKLKFGHDKQCLVDKFL